MTLVNILPDPSSWLPHRERGAVLSFDPTTTGLSARNPDPHCQWHPRLTTLPVITNLRRPSLILTIALQQGVQKHIETRPISTRLASHHRDDLQHDSHLNAACGVSPTKCRRLISRQKVAVTIPHSRGAQIAESLHQGSCPRGLCYSGSSNSYSWYDTGTNH